MSDGPHPRRAAPLRAIRHHCLQCCGTSHEVALCISTGCSLFLFRTGHRPEPVEVEAVGQVQAHPRELPMTQGAVAAGSRLKAIRRRCLDCSGNNIAEVRNCRQTGCPLYAYKMGKSGRTMSDQQRAAATERLARHRQGRLPSETPAESTVSAGSAGGPLPM